MKHVPKISNLNQFYNHNCISESLDCHNVPVAATFDIIINKCSQHKNVVCMHACVKKFFYIRDNKKYVEKFMCEVTFSAPYFISVVQ